MCEEIKNHIGSSGPSIKKQIKDFHFVDSSHHHPDFDPKKYLESIEFLGVSPILSNKCTQGISMVDPSFQTRKELCKKHGIKYSGYHFYECKKDPIKQADHYIKNHGTFELPPQVDYEIFKTKFSEQTENDLLSKKEDLYVMLCYLEKTTGMTPWIYLNYGAAGRLKFDSRFGRFPVWLARYNPILGSIPAPWTKETLGAWQFTESGKFPGFKDGNDVNLYYGSSNVLNL